MPLYEYQCTQCSRITEKRQKFSDPELTECPHCKGRLERTISAPAVQFKGGGWYSDLYSSPKSTAKAASGDSGSTASAGESKSTSSESSGAAASAPAAPPSTPAAK